MRKAVVIVGYYDNVLERRMTKGDEILLTDERFESLSSGKNDAGIPLVAGKGAELKKPNKAVKA